MIHTGVKINIRGAQFQDLKLYRDCETIVCIFVYSFIRYRLKMYGERSSYGGEIVHRYIVKLRTCLFQRL